MQICSYPATDLQPDGYSRPINLLAQRATGLAARLLRPDRTDIVCDLRKLYRKMSRYEGRLKYSRPDHVPIFLGKI
jgi:hypothetical protein